MRHRLLLPAIALGGALTFAACGSSGTSSNTAVSTPGTGATAASTTTAAGSLAPTTTVAKPSVKLPPTTPTELVTTVITPGAGPAAVAGDTLAVRYVGVRSEDGTEFDSNFDGAPFQLKLGGGQVIQGWDQGLVGAQAGERLQLDIPAELAYGDTPRGEVIKAGDALSFVIDVVAVVNPGTAADQPTVVVTGAPNRSDLVVTDLVDGTGPVLADGQTAVLQLVAYRGDTGEQVFSTWADSSPLSFVYGVDQVIPGLANGVDGMKVGGRRQLTVPFEQAFGAEGSEGLGVPGSTDVVLVVDLVAAY